MILKKNLPNIILIVCDTLGAKHMSLYGYERETTPHLEQLVDKEGFTVYTNCYSTSCWTSPSHASLFTGLYPHEHGVNESNLLLPSKLATLPELLNSMGYKTIGISCNGLIGKFSGFNRGFEFFREMDRWHLFNQSAENLIKFQNFVSDAKNHQIFRIIRWIKEKKDIAIPVKYVLNKLFLKWKLPLDSKFFWKINRGVINNATPYTNKALKNALRILKDAERPVFIFINLMQTHIKYNPPKGFRNKWSDYNSPYKRCSQNPINHYAHTPFTQDVLDYFCALYDEEILYLDYKLCDFLKKLKEIHLDRMMVIITSDHGEHFGEDGHFSHMLSLHDAVTKIPLLIKFPGSTKAEHISSLVQINDLYATVLDLVNAPFPIPRSSISLTRLGRKQALMEITRPEVWLDRIKDHRLKDKFAQTGFRREIRSEANLR